MNRPNFDLYKNSLEIKPVICNQSLCTQNCCLMTSDENELQKIPPKFTASIISSQGYTHDNWNLLPYAQAIANSEKPASIITAFSSSACISNDSLSNKENDAKYSEQSIPIKKKKKNIIQVIRKKISNVLENLSSKTSTQHNSTHKSKSLELLTDNCLGSKSFSEEFLSQGSSSRNIISYGCKIQNDRQCVCLAAPSVTLPVSSHTNGDININNILSKSKNEVSKTVYISSHKDYSCKPQVTASNDVMICGRTTCNFISPSKDSSAKSGPALEASTDIFVSAHFEEPEVPRLDSDKPITNSENVSSGQIRSIDICECINGTGGEGKAAYKREIVKNIDKNHSDSTIVSRECRSLAQELRELAKHGWYWGSMNNKEAEEKLAGEPDGAFLVRDSSDVKYLHTLSFRSYGRTLHTRIEHSNGWFSFYYPQPDSDGYRSVVELIEHCMSESDAGVFCYSRPLLKESPSFPVRLTKAVSRFMKVRSLQYLCRFVIRQYFSINQIQKLPVPTKIKNYLEESYY